MSYGVKAFAKLAGVTVRALHHYDRLGLLRPRRTESGYRRYVDADLARLEQIVALKFIGLPLKQIKTLLTRDPREWPRTLAVQRRALERKRRHLDLAIAAITDAERLANAGEPPDAATVKHIIEVIDMENQHGHWKQYYSEEAWAKLAERREHWTTVSQQAQAEVTQAWTTLFADVQAAIDRGVDPASPVAHTLADRWRELVRGFTGGDPQLSEGLKNAWADRANWPADEQQRSAPFMDPRVWKFVEEAGKARK
jgi:MerR family transcriptional regulator, thiopeptide resistance regulator